MTTIIDRVEQHLFRESDLSVATISQAVESISRYQQDYADIFLQEVVMEYWQLEDGLVKDASFNLNKGLGIRSIDGEKTGFAYANQFESTALNNALAAATSISRAGQSKAVSFNQIVPSQSLYTEHKVLGDVEPSHKIALLRQLDAKARQLDEKVKQVMVSLSAADEHMLVAAIDGTLAADIRPMIRLNVTVVAEHQGRRERGSAGMGGRYDWQHLMSLDLESLASQAVHQAVVNLEAVEAPAGTMPVVLGNGWPGVLLHEAIGHGLEGDFNRKGSSAYAGRIGEKVASELCTVVDDGTLEGQRGSLNVDDEGTRTQSTVLIENGVLKGYMQDKLNARLMGMAPTGNGRRESFAHLPMPRMTNTYMLAGEHDPGEIIESVERGLYAVNFMGGQVDITNGKFVFSASEAYLIENGKIKHPVKGATLIGDGPTAMQRVSMVGNDLQFDQGLGMCGKDGQTIPVGIGQPSMKIDKLTVGGTQV